MESLRCIAELGDSGCAFQMPLEAARRALDPGYSFDPTFLRADALLVVALLMARDDCSARNPLLFDPAQQSLQDPLGPLTPFRCFEFGVTCDKNDRTVEGPRRNCRPDYEWLHGVGGYMSFFEHLKAGRGMVSFGVVSGPVEPVGVSLVDGAPALAPSCATTFVEGRPALRLEAVQDHLGGTFASICDVDGYEALWRQLAQGLSDPMAGCVYGDAVAGLTAAVAARSGAAVCHPSVEQCRGREVKKPLKDADCEVTTGTSDVRVEVPRCDDSRFEAPWSRDCGARCPCWRLVPQSSCSASGLAVEILRAEPKAGSEYASARCKHAPRH